MTIMMEVAWYLSLRPAMGMDLKLQRTVRSRSRVYMYPRQRYERLCLPCPDIPKYRVRRLVILRSSKCIFGNLCASIVAETSDNRRSGSGIKGVFVFRTDRLQGVAARIISSATISRQIDSKCEGKRPSRNRTTNAGGLVPYYGACMGNRYGVHLMTDHSINWRLCRIKDVPKVNTKTSKLHSDIHTCTRLVPKCYLIPPSPSIPRAIHSRKRSHR